MASSGSVTLLLPPVKCVVVYRNGDPFYSGRRFVVNHRQVATMEVFLNDVTHCIQAPLAVRTLYTPRQGHRVRELHDLQNGAQYVAAGFERFKKLDYLNTGLKKLPVPRGEGARARLLHRPNVSAKWRKYILLPCIIHVFRNEDLRCSPFRFIIPRTWQHDLDQILGLVTEKASLRTGAVRRLCTLDGVTVSSADELVSGQYYVAVGAERFKKLPYVELLVPKASERNYPGNRRLSRRYKGRKAASGPEDSYSDSALLDSPESDGRRVKSTGDKVGEMALPSIQRRPVKEESSIFYARSVKVRARNRAHPRPPPKSGPAQASVFKAVRRRREEVQGAEEVLEDKNTAVDLPVDQSVAETVEDEDLIGRNPPHSNSRDQTLTKATEGKMFREKYPLPHPEHPDKVESSTEKDRNSPANTSSTICKEDDVNGSPMPYTEAPQVNTSLEHEMHSTADPSVHKKQGAALESCVSATETPEQGSPHTPHRHRNGAVRSPHQHRNGAVRSPHQTP
ncbi:doublecortin domain-containing protein 2-like isoform X2 [Coregonus clupeaformis]|uniref:doublecortin domain-containing protein 2-like isoform X2 n=1 Tax=Coregonus clupeaformis TaxID=59861 RepID=UPI001E1C73B2|nr:doublecortin domain-containing protein 2-like isoform X2 [Coregonus clupeaformis]